jgi:hypothetical protein
MAKSKQANGKGSKAKSGNNGVENESVMTLTSGIGSDKTALRQRSESVASVKSHQRKMAKSQLNNGVATRFNAIISRTLLNSGGSERGGGAGWRRRAAQAYALLRKRACAFLYARGRKRKAKSNHRAKSEENNGENRRRRRAFSA